MDIETTCAYAESKQYQGIQRISLYVTILPKIRVVQCGSRFAETLDKELDFALYPMIEAKYDMENVC